MDTGDEQKQAFLACLENLLLSRRKISRQQAAMFSLYARLNGWTRRKPYQTKDDKRAELARKYFSQGGSDSP
ncbi:MAG: hypothetical protein DMG97_43245 [Acidobacteria bacterium]|nr:MAG: hypothetical protein DMG97_43245 [Acidobacteriota bacterium]